MTFDPFRDFDSRGHLRNFFGSKDVEEIKALEYSFFQINVERAINTLAAIDFIEYKHVLDIHRTLFGDVYPWAGQDRLATAPDINISKGGYGAMFAQPPYIRRVTDYALDRSRDLTFMREQPGYIMGSLAHAHPFLDGNGRTIMVLHTEMADRAGISIDWVQTDKTAYLTALTKELNDPGKGHLDEYLKPFIRSAVDRQATASMLKSLKGLGTPDANAVEVDVTKNVPVDNSVDLPTLTKKEQILRDAKVKKQSSTNSPPKKKPPGQDLGGR